MGSRLISALLLVIGCWLLIGCGTEPVVEPVAPVKQVGDAQTSEKPTMQEPKLELNPNYQGN